MNPVVLDWNMRYHYEVCSHICVSYISYTSYVYRQVGRYRNTDVHA